MKSVFELRLLIQILFSETIAIVFSVMLGQIQLSLFYFTMFSFSYTNTHLDESVNVYCQSEFLSKYTQTFLHFLALFVGFFFCFFVF